MTTLQQLSEIGIGVADRLPIEGKSATDKDCIARADEVDRALSELGITIEATVPHHWYTVVFESGAVAGRFADTLEEAVVDCAMWWHEPVVKAVLDDDQAWSRALKAAAKQTAPALFDLDDPMTALANARLNEGENA